MHVHCDSNQTIFFSVFKTGVGKICADINDCVQNEKNMMCTRQSQTDTTKKCLCGSYTYHAGAVCISSE